MLHNTRGKLVCSMSHFIWEWEVLLLMINRWCTLRSPLNIHGELGLIETGAHVWYQTLDFKFYACITTHCFLTPTFTPLIPPPPNWCLQLSVNMNHHSFLTRNLNCPNDVSLVNPPTTNILFPPSHHTPSQL